MYVVCVKCNVNIQFFMVPYRKVFVSDFFTVLVIMIVLFRELI